MAFRALPSKFWYDTRLRTLSVEERLAFVWLYTNDTRNIIGVSEFDPLRFEVETQLRPTIMDAAVSKLQATEHPPLHGGGAGGGAGGGLVGRWSLPMVVGWWGVSGGCLMVLNFLADQYDEKPVSNRNSMWSSIYKAVMVLPDEPRSWVFKRYPWVIENLKLNHQPTTTPMVKEKEKEKERVNSLYSSYPTDAEIMAFGKTWPGEPASGAPAMADQWVIEWIARIRARSGADTFPSDWKAAIVAGWRRDFRNWTGGRMAGQGHQGGNGDGKNGAKMPSVWALTEQLKALRTRAENHPANPESASFTSDGLSPEEESDFASLQREINNVNIKLSEGRE